MEIALGIGETVGYCLFPHKGLVVLLLIIEPEEKGFKYLDNWERK